MKVTKERSAANRAALVGAASALFRERGYDGVGVAEICEDAGLTHGALYAQFGSKEALAAEAFVDGLAQARPHFLRAGRTGLAGFLDFLLSTRQRDALAQGCPMTASASDAARRDPELGAAYAHGFEEMVAAIGATLADDGGGAASRRARALTIVAAEIGAMAVSRAVKAARPELSVEVLRATRATLGAVGGA